MDVIINSALDYAPQASKPLITQGDYLLNFLTCLGYESSQPPLGDLLRCYHHLDGEWVVAAPIHWEATHNDAMIVAAGEDLHLSEAQSHAWFNDIAAFLDEEGITMHYHNAQTWLLRVDGKPPLVSKPVHLMMHQSLMPAFAVMDASNYWQRLLTELQMLLSSHPRNTVQESAFPINGLWLFGEGSFLIKNNVEVFTDSEHFLACFPNHFKSLNFLHHLEPLHLETMKHRSNSSSSPQKNAIFLINNIKNIDLNLLQKLASNYSTRWFWNNMAYSCTKTNWLKTLWRRVNAYQTKGNS